MKNMPTHILTNHFKQYEVAAWAVYVLGGANHSVDTEDAAIKCHAIAPTLFSWQKYKSQINLELVRVSLSDAKKSKYGGLLSGSGREGWRLSSRGLDWIRAREQSGKIFTSTSTRGTRSKAGSIDTVRRERERQRLLISDAWQEWRNTGSLNVRAAQQVFRIDEYTTQRMTAIKVARLRAMFDADDDLTRFLQRASQIVLKQGEADER